MKTAVCLNCSCHDGISLNDDVLHDLLFLWAEDLGEGVVELRLPLLHSCGKENWLAIDFKRVISLCLDIPRGWVAYLKECF